MATSSFIGLGIKPTLDTVLAISTSKIKAIFSEGMSPTGLTDTSNYTITPLPGSVPVLIDSVELDPASAPSYVVLNIVGDMTIGTANYSLTVSGNFEDSAGNKIDPASITKTFDGYGTQPDLAYIETHANDLTILDVSFTKAVKQTSPSNSDDALNPANYSITGDSVVTIQSVSTIDANTVRLNVSGLVNSGQYSLTVSNVKDLAENVIV